MIRRAATAALTGLGQAALILLGTAAAIDWDISAAARAIGVVACLSGMSWISTQAAINGRRQGFEQGWKMRGLQADVLAFRHMTRDKGGTA